MNSQASLPLSTRPLPASSTTIAFYAVAHKTKPAPAAIEPAKHGNAMYEIFGNYGWQEGVRKDIAQVPSTGSGVTGIVQLYRQE